MLRKQIVQKILVLCFFWTANVSWASSPFSCDSLSYSAESSSFLFINLELLHSSAAELARLELSIADLESDQNIESSFGFIVKKTKIAKWKKEFKSFIQMGGSQALQIYQMEQERLLFENGKSESSEKDIKDKKNAIVKKDEWEVTPWQPKHNIAMSVNEKIFAKFNPNGEKLATIARGSVCTWDRKTGNFISRYSVDNEYQKTVQFSSDGRMMVTIGMENKAIVRDMDTKKLLQTFEAYGIWGKSKGHTKVLQSAQFSPDGTKVITTSSDGTAIIWSIKTGKVIHTLSGENEWFRSAQFSPDGNTVITASSEFNVYLWNANTGELLKTFTVTHGSLLDAQFDPKGKMVVITAVDNKIMLWDFINGNLIQTFIGHSGALTNLRFHPEGKSVIAISKDGTNPSEAIIWDIESGRKAFALKGINSTMNSAEFSPDGKSIVTASDDGSAIVWEKPENGEP